MSSRPSELHVSADPTTFERALLALEQWFNKSAYAQYVPYVLGALAMGVRLWMMRREMAKASRQSAAARMPSAQAGSATGTAPAPSTPAAPTPSKQAGAKSTGPQKRKGK